MLYGPNTNLGGNSIIYMLEGQIGYVTGAIRALDAERLAWLDVRPDVQDAFNSWVQSASRTSVWESGCHNWYTTASGRNINNWPDHTFLYRYRVRRFDLAAYRVRPGPTGHGRGHRGMNARSGQRARSALPAHTARSALPARPARYALPARTARSALPARTARWAPRVPPAVMRLGVRQLGKRCLDPTLPWPVQRSRLEQLGRAQRLPSGTAVAEEAIGGVPAEVVSAGGPDPALTVIHFHGGGYCVGSAGTAREWAAHLSAGPGAGSCCPSTASPRSIPTRRHSRTPARS